MWLFKDANYDFMGRRKIGFAISAFLIVLSLISLVMHGGPKYGIDFRGGTLIELRFLDANDSTKTSDVQISEVRTAFEQLGFPDAEIKTFGSGSEVSVNLPANAANPDELKDIHKKVAGLMPAYTIENRRQESVGPKIGQELVGSAIWSILFAMLLILIYIMIRFELRFGVGAVVALAHDVTITLGLFSLVDLEITVAVIAAMLTIVGYSLNDTIVVFDRIRENLKRRYTSYTAVVNSSINQTLSRTIVTSGTTLIVVVILFFFGGEILKDFALALTCGILIGTYSSIFIASPILIEWEKQAKGAKLATTKK